MRLLTWMPRELIQDLRAIDPVLDHAPPIVPDPESILRRTDLAGSAIGTSPSPSDFSNRITTRSRRWLAPICASAVIVAVAGGVLAYAGRARPDGRLPASSSSPSVTQPVVSTDPVDLTSTSWQLTRIIDARGAVPDAASAAVVFTFMNAYATDHVGDSAASRITPGRIQFGTWSNNLLILRGPRLDIAQSNFVWGSLDEMTLAWRITGDTLTISLRGGGTLVFARHTFDAKQAFGTVSGQFMADGGPAGTPSPRPIPGIGTVRFTNTETGQTQTIDTTSDGTYATSMAPGTFTVTGTISSYQSGHSICRATKPIVVQKDRTTRADVYCQEK